jgi:dolichol-phosphate mannosyltransferase
MLLSFVLSFRNEEETIPELIRRIDATAKSIENFEYEMIFVNDDSNDGSEAILRQNQAQYPITLVNTSRRFGVTPCVLAGMAQAKGDAVVYLDCDLQDPPELVPEMVAKFRAGADVVHTTRRTREGEGALKLWLTKRAYRIINILSEINLPENTGDFKLLSRRVVDHILSLKEYDPYMRGLSVWVGFRQEFILYDRHARFSGVAKFPLFSANPPREFIRGLTAYSAVPLYLSLWLGLLTSCFAVLLIFYAIITKLLGISAPGASSVLIAVAFFSGMVLITNGIMGIYVARIYYEVKERPRYILKDVIRPPTAQP